MRVFWILAMIFAFPLGAALPITTAYAIQTTFSGTYTATIEDGPATLILSQDGSGNITGSLKTGDASGTVKGHIESGRVAGTMMHGGNSLPFTITRENGTLRLAIGDQELVFKASGSVVPKPVPIATKETGRAKNVAKANPSVNASSVPAGWKAYRNPIGLTFRYPASWNMTDVNGLLLLLPPGAKAAQGATPSEIYAVIGTPAPGVRRVDDPRLLQMADSLVAQMFPYMRRSGDGETTSLGGIDGTSGLIVTYDGSNPTTGKPSRLRSYAVVHKELLLQIQALGERDKVASRDSILRQIYGSITAGPRIHDPQIIGNWAGVESSSERVKTDAASGRLGSSVSSQSASKYRLSPDGTLEALTTSRSAISISSSKSIPESQRVDANLDTGNQYQWKKGRWYAGHGKIVVIMEDGTGMNADYQVVGGTLVVQFAGGASVRFTRF